MQTLALKTTINFMRKAWTGYALWNKPRKVLDSQITLRKCTLYPCLIFYPDIDMIIGHLADILTLKNC